MLEKRAVKLLVVVLAATFFALAADGPLTDSKIMGLAQAGVSEAELIRMVGAAPQIEFDLRPIATDAMMKAGVSENVIRAMAAREGGAAATVPSSVAAGIARGSAGNTPQVLGPAPVPEVGAYYLESGGWIEMMPEVVNWKTGGVIKSVGTVGIVKGDVNGRINGTSSRTRLTRPVQLLVYCPEGTAISEYQLIRLRTHSNAREFRTVTGGVFHRSGGATRDTLELPATEHIAQRTWTLMIPADMPQGQYGLLPPSVSAQSASAQLGKMYTFTVVE